MARAAAVPPLEEGLLFMCYNSDIKEQYEYSQQRINIAEAANRALIPGIQQFVTFRGGEYFFAPSISGLRALGKP